jgi:hypothetical protein
MADKVEQENPSDMMSESKQENTIPEASTSAAAPTIAQQIWQRLQNIELELFSIPNQFVSKYFQPLFVEHDRLYLTTNVSAALATLELKLPKDLEMTSYGKYIIVKTRNKINV